MEPDLAAHDGSSAWRRTGTLVSAANALLAFMFATSGTFSPTAEFRTSGAGRFFWAQAEAIVRGRLWVDRADLIGECYLVGKRCFGYYGLTPSLLRLPLLPLLRVVDSGLASVAVSIAIGVATWFAIDLAARVAAHSNSDLLTVRWVRWAVCLQLGPGSVLVFAATPMVYQEAVAWAVAFSIITLNLLWRQTVAPRPRRDLFIVLFGVLAANGRPTAMCLCVGLGAWWVWSRRTERGTRLVAPACLLVVPAALMITVFMVKFGEPIPNLLRNEQVPEADHWAKILSINDGRTEGPVFLPTSTIAYLRPDSIRFTTVPPFVSLRFTGGDTPSVWPLPAGGAYTERVTSLTDVMPASVLAVGLLATRRRRRVPSAIWPLLAASVLAILPTVTNVSMSERYLPDFYPLAVIAIASALCGVEAENIQRRRTVRVVGTLAVAWSVLIAVGLYWSQVFP